MSFIQGDQGYQGYRVVYPSHPGRADGQGKGRRNRETESLRETTSSRLLSLPPISNRLLRHHPGARSRSSSARTFVGCVCRVARSKNPRTLIHAATQRIRLRSNPCSNAGLGVHPLLHFDRTQDRNCLSSLRVGSISACLAEERSSYGITVRQHTRTSSPPRQLASLATSLSVTRIHHCPVLVQSSPAI